MKTLNQLIDHMEWLNPPKEAQYHANQESLTMTTKLNTDFWQQTHYQFKRDDGHFYGLKPRGNFHLSAKITMSPSNRYDQAGLMLRGDSGNWLKTSIEYIPEGLNKLGSVVTRSDFSDWATQEIEEGSQCYLRLIRIADDVYIAWSKEGEQWLPMRMCHFEDGQQVGFYSCSPQGENLTVSFSEVVYFEGIADRTKAYQ